MLFYVGKESNKYNMQFRNFFFLLVFTFLLFGTSSVVAQQITTNENGERIIVYPDGTWKYLVKEDPAGPSKTAGKAKLSAPNSKTQRSMDKRQQFSPVLVKAMEAAERAAAEESQAQKELALTTSNYNEVKEAIDEADLYDDLSDDEYAALKKQLKSAKRAQKDARNRLKDANKNLLKAEKLVAAVEKNPNKALKLAAKKRTKSKKKSGKGKSDLAVKVKEPVSGGKSIYNSTSDRKFASFDATMDVMQYPPNTDCQLAFDGVDEFSGKKRRDVASQFFFSYTNDELRAYYKERDFISCEGYVSSLTGGYKFLTLTISIASETAQRDYGIIEKGSIIHIKLLNGNTVKLFNNKTDIGIVDPLNRTTTYVAQYIISSSDEKQLKKEEVDKVRMIWSSGYEDYEVYELDFFINQLECLNQK